MFKVLVLPPAVEYTLNLRLGSIPQYTHSFVATVLTCSSVRLNSIFLVLALCKLLCHKAFQEVSCG